MKSVALIACTNGYGHTRRLLLIAEALGKFGIKSTLFAPASIANYLSDLLEVNTPKIINFDTETTTSDWIKGNSGNWVNRIPDLSEYDEVISDNLVDILKVRNDSWLSGSFLWHESLRKIPQRVTKDQTKLLAKFRPKMFSSGLFTSQKLRSQLRVIETGLFGKKFQLQNKKNDVLIAIGKGGQFGSSLNLFIEEISMKKSVPFESVWVDHRILPKSVPNWMKSATFERAMYEKIRAAIIRPGVGTATDAILAGAKIFAFYEDSNLEMMENAFCLETMKLGRNSKYISDAWKMALEYSIDKKQQYYHKKIISKLNPSGADEVAKTICKKLKNKK